MRMTLTQAATALGINREVLRRHCAAGRVPGAFQFVKGGTWYLPANVAEILHNSRGPALRTQEEQCQSVSEGKRGGSTSPHGTASELDAVLAQLTAKPPRNCTTN